VQPDSLLDDAEDCKVVKIEAPPQDSARRVVYDECTVRMMFIEMDANANGTVSKEEFINFLRGQPQLQNTMHSACQTAAVEKDQAKISPQAARAMGIKRIISLYREIDTDRAEKITWDEFLDFFHRTGLLLAYSTPANPRVRMAAALASEYQRRVSQKGAESLGVAQPIVVQGLTSKFLIDQKEQQLNTQWAAEKLSQLQEQSFKRQDALSIVEDSIFEMKKAAQLAVGRPAKKVDSSSTPEARRIINYYTQAPADRSRLQSPKEPATTQPEDGITEDGDESKPLPAATPCVQSKSPALKLPSLLQPLDAGCKGCTSPFRPLTRRSCSIVCGSRSPKKRGRTPRRSQRALNTEAVCQSSFGF
jgi:hypothetical protein